MSRFEIVDGHRSPLQFKTGGGTVRSNEIGSLSNEIDLRNDGAGFRGVKSTARGCKIRPACSEREVWSNEWTFLGTDCRVCDVRRPERRVCPGSGAVFGC